MKKYFYLALVFLSLFFNELQAQNNAYKWYVSTGLHAVNHRSVRGLFDQYFLTDNWSLVPPISQLTIARTLNSSFSVDLQASIGEVDNFRLDHNDEFMALAGLGLRYRLANGYILKQHSWFDPYFRVGANYYRHPYRGIEFNGILDTRGDALENGEVADHDFFAISGGVGINFWIWKKVGINIESQYVSVPSVKSDYIDFFQAKAGVAFRFGVSDRDGDGILDKDDACPDEPGIPNEDPELHGCPDKDGDGIPDKIDACPDEPGLPNEDPDLHGCPDTDGDGIYDKYDDCPQEYCPDGVETEEYYCENGCKILKPLVEPEPVIEEPEVTEGDVLSFENVLFEFDESVLTADGEGQVKKAAAKIIADGGKYYFVDGFADSIGSEAYNLKLSRRRAESVKEALIKEGVKPEQLEVRAFGEQFPKCTNETEEGRACNRRVVVLERY